MRAGRSWGALSHARRWISRIRCLWKRKVASVKSTDRLSVIQYNSFIHAYAAAADANAVVRRYRYNRYASLMPMLRLENRS